MNTTEYVKKKLLNFNIPYFMKTKQTQQLACQENISKHNLHQYKQGM